MRFYCKWCGEEVEEGQGYCDSDCWTFEQQAEQEAEQEAIKRQEEHDELHASEQLGIYLSERVNDGKL